MRFYDVSFFMDKDDKVDVCCHIQKSTFDKSPLVIFNSDPEHRYGKPSVTIFLDDEQQLINFKNSVIAAYESYQRRKHATNDPKPTEC